MKNNQNYEVWESLVNPPVLGAGDRQFDSGHLDQWTWFPN